LGPVDVGSVGDSKYLDLAPALIDLIDEAVTPAASGVKPFELAMQRMAHPGGLLEKRSEHELDNRRRGLLGKPLESSLCRWSHDQLPRRFRHALPR
jgi:hypothetical protein